MKPLIIGMNNPVSTKPGHELYPWPEGCTGHRLWKMLAARTGASMVQYRDAFERRNLVRGLAYDRLAARARAHEIVCRLEGSERTVLLLGNEVREAFHWVMANNSMGYGLNQGLPPLLVHAQWRYGVQWRQIPHPSGRNRWYSDPENVRVVEMLLEELYNGARFVQPQAEAV